MAQDWTIAHLKRMLLRSALVSSFITSSLAAAFVAPALGLKMPETTPSATIPSDADLFASLSSTLSVEEARSQLFDLTQFPLSAPPASGTLSASSDRLSPTDISEPSLTWIREQLGERYGSDRLVAQWKAYQSDSPESLSYVDVIVDEQIWGLLSYFERYAFISQFGVAAKQYGYHLRVFHSGDILNDRDAQNTGSSRPVLLRGAHICGFESSPIVAPVPIDLGAASDIPCEIMLNDASRRDRL